MDCNYNRKPSTPTNTIDHLSTIIGISSTNNAASITTTATNVKINDCPKPEPSISHIGRRGNNQGIKSNSNSKEISKSGLVIENGSYEPYVHLQLSKFPFQSKQSVAAESHPTLSISTNLKNISPTKLPYKKQPLIAHKFQPSTLPVRSLQAVSIDEFEYDHAESSSIPSMDNPMHNLSHKHTPLDISLPQPSMEENEGETSVEKEKELSEQLHFMLPHKGQIADRNEVDKRRLSDNILFCHFSHSSRKNGPLEKCGEKVKPSIIKWLIKLGVQSANRCNPQGIHRSGNVGDHILDLSNEFHNGVLLCELCAMLRPLHREENKGADQYDR
jgi:hypothetical protein